ncbi:hypothetical protein DUNSADRAFT_11851 [Dunaliella salina]|uniref:Transmembrane protein n=1 Tax=Dunaliella salina TaxID=3046 RepID=A0ABQ7GCF8_DUNSA|nr:hypothetical protein DUNSADRAFT_11851 [Dunaliella salina]|eukprot:KAF5832286.1 hypothetical protein DUNSADRAFT_11851 [Dunaliella salina]
MLISFDSLQQSRRTLSPGGSARVKHHPSQVSAIQLPASGVYAMLLQALLKAGRCSLALCCLLMLTPKCSAAAAPIAHNVNADDFQIDVVVEGARHALQALEKEGRRDGGRDGANGLQKPLTSDGDSIVAGAKRALLILEEEGHSNNEKDDHKVQRLRRLLAGIDNETYIPERRLLQDQTDVPYPADPSSPVTAYCPRGSVIASFVLETSPDSVERLNSIGCSDGTTFQLHAPVDAGVAAEQKVTCSSGFTGFWEGYTEYEPMGLRVDLTWLKWRCNSADTRVYGDTSDSRGSDFPPPAVCRTGFVGAKFTYNEGTLTELELICNPPDSLPLSPPNPCQSSSSSSAVNYITLDLDFEDAAGDPTFREQLKQTYEENVFSKFRGFFAFNGRGQCPDFVQMNLLRGSVVAEFVIHLGAGSTPEEAAALEEELGSMGAEKAGNIMLPGLQFNGQPVEVTGSSKNRPSKNRPELEPRAGEAGGSGPTQATSDSDSNKAKVLGPAIAVPVFFFLLAVALGSYFIFRRSRISPTVTIKLRDACQETV